MDGSWGVEALGSIVSEPIASESPGPSAAFHHSEARSSEFTALCGLLDSSSSVFFMMSDQWRVWSRFEENKHRFSRTVRGEWIESQLQPLRGASRQRRPTSGGKMAPLRFVSFSAAHRRPNCFRDAFFKVLALCRELAGEDSLGDSNAN
jgi:hypothetical protein